MDRINRCLKVSHGRLIKSDHLTEKCFVDILVLIAFISVNTSSSVMTPLRVFAMVMDMKMLIGLVLGE